MPPGSAFHGHERIVPVTRRTRPLLLVIALCAASGPASAQLHPLIGTWQWTRSANQCTETYDYRPDGVLRAVSGTEITEGTYAVSPQADPNGFYELSGNFTETNQGKDCTDSPPVADPKPYTVYVVFHESRTRMLVCYKPSLERCFGPLRRIDVNVQGPGGARRPA